MLAGQNYSLPLIHSSTHPQMYFNFQVQYQILNWKLKSWYNSKVESEYPRVGQLMRKTCEVVKHIQFIAISTRVRVKWLKGRKLSTTVLRPLPCFIFSKEKQTNKTITSHQKLLTHPPQNTLTFIFQEKGTKDWKFGVKPSQRHTSVTHF